MKLREASYCSNERSRPAIRVISGSISRSMSRSTFGLAAGLFLALVGTFGLSPRASRADEIDDTVKKLVDLDQRVHLMTLEFKEAPPPPPDAADRQRLDQQAPQSGNKFEEAANIPLYGEEKQ